MSTLDVNEHQMASFAEQLIFLFETCKICLLGIQGCRGCIEHCVHPEAWPEETVTYYGDEGDTARLHGWAMPEEDGRMPGYVKVYDSEGNPKHKRMVMITLPQLH